MKRQWFRYMALHRLFLVAELLPFLVKAIISTVFIRVANMTAIQDKSDIVRTERGLTINGTRITLYDLMDYIHAGYPAKIIRNYFFYITDQQFNSAIAYIQLHNDQLESEYRQVLQEAEENRQYWSEKNKDRFTQDSKLPPTLEYEAAWEKLQVWKARLANEA